VAKPDFDLMWRLFPDHVKYPNLESLFTFLGGGLKRNIYEDGFGPEGNTCAVRMSYVCNYGGLLLHGSTLKALDLHPLWGDDHKAYLFRVREMKKYFANQLGRPNEIVKKDFMSAFAGKRGIVAYDVANWSDASGHLALWNGKEFRETHDDYRSLQDDPTTEVKEAQVTQMALWVL
jgi:hypothetical protein